MAKSAKPRVARKGRSVAKSPANHCCKVVLDGKVVATGTRSAADLAELRQIAAANGAELHIAGKPAAHHEPALVLLQGGKCVAAGSKLSDRAQMEKLAKKHGGKVVKVAGGVRANPGRETEAMLAAKASPLLAKTTALRAMPAHDFAEAWAALHTLFPGLHPDEAPIDRPPQPVPLSPQDSWMLDIDPRFAGDYDDGSGWPIALIPAAREAWKRYEVGRLTDEEFYPQPLNVWGNPGGGKPTVGWVAYDSTGCVVGMGKSKTEALAEPREFAEHVRGVKTAPCTQALWERVCEVGSAAQPWSVGADGVADVRGIASNPGGDPLAQLSKMGLGGIADTLRDPNLPADSYSHLLTDLRATRDTGDWPLTAAQQAQIAAEFGGLSYGDFDSLADERRYENRVAELERANFSQWSQRAKQLIDAAWAQRFGGVRSNPGGSRQRERGVRSWPQKPQPHYAPSNAAHPTHLPVTGDVEAYHATAAAKCRQDAANWAAESWASKDLRNRHASHLAAAKDAAKRLQAFGSSRGFGGHIAAERAIHSNPGGDNGASHIASCRDKNCPVCKAIPGTFAYKSASRALDRHYAKPVSVAGRHAANVERMLQGNPPRHQPVGQPLLDWQPVARRVEPVSLPATQYQAESEQEWEPELPTQRWIGQDIALCLINDGMFYPRRESLGKLIESKMRLGRYERELAWRSVASLVKAFLPTYRKHSNYQIGKEALEIATDEVLDVIESDAEDNLRQERTTGRVRMNRVHPNPAADNDPNLAPAAKIVRLLGGSKRFCDTVATTGLWAVKGGLQAEYCHNEDVTKPMRLEIVEGRGGSYTVVFYALNRAGEVTATVEKLLDLPANQVAKVVQDRTGTSGLAPPTPEQQHHIPGFGVPVWQGGAGHAAYSSLEID